MNRVTQTFTLTSIALAGFALTSLLVGDLAAQSLQQRIDHVRQQQRQEQREQALAQQRAVQQGEARAPSIAQRMRQRIERVELDGVPAREAFDWWSRRTDVPLVIDWDTMLVEGVDPDQPLTLELQHVPAGQLLQILMRQVSPEVRLIHEPTPWYVRVMTRTQANRDMVVRIYDVGDLVMVVPQFDSPPRMGVSATSGSSGRDATNRGGRGSGARGQSGIGGGGSNAGGRTGGGNRTTGGGRSTGGGGLFGDDGRGDDTPTREERGDELANMIRETVEPDIWAETAGGEASVRYFEGRLIVRAPRYVHAQIGQPVISLDRTRPRTQSAPASSPRMHRATQPPRSPVPHRRRPGIAPPSRSPSGIIDNRRR